VTSPVLQLRVPEATLGSLVTAMSPGEPSPGTLCTGPGCFQRDTRRYRLRELPLCTACAAALTSETDKRQIPPGAARALRRGAA